MKKERINIKRLHNNHNIKKLLYFIFGSSQTHEKKTFTFCFAAELLSDFWNPIDEVILCLLLMFLDEIYGTSWLIKSERKKNRVFTLGMCENKSIKEHPMDLYRHSIHRKWCPRSVYYRYQRQCHSHKMVAHMCTITIQQQHGESNKTKLLTLGDAKNTWKKKEEYVFNGCLIMSCGSFVF